MLNEYMQAKYALIKAAKKAGKFENKKTELDGETTKAENEK